MLGPLEVLVDGRQIRVGAAKQRAILAVLAAHAGKVVRVESLVTEVWGSDPPKSAVANLRTYLMRLRKLLFPDDEGNGGLITTQAGYLLRIDAEQIDLCRFETTLKQAHKAMADSDFGAAEAALGQALSLWGGEFAQDVEAGPTLRNVAARVGELYADALKDYADVKRQLGDHAAAVDRLRHSLSAIRCGNAHTAS